MSKDSMLNRIEAETERRRREWIEEPNEESGYDPAEEVNDPVLNAVGWAVIAVALGISATVAVRVIWYMARMLLFVAQVGGKP